MISPRHALRLWELTEHALQDGDAALTVAARHQVGELDLCDYLFSTAATLRDGLRASSRYLPLLTTNGRLRAETETERETTYSYSYLDAGGRGAGLALQFSIAVFCARAQAGTGQPWCRSVSGSPSRRPARTMRSPRHSAPASSATPPPLRTPRPTPLG